MRYRTRYLLQEHKGPRPINPFIMYCQVQKDIFAKSKTRRSAAETRKIFGDMWRKCTEEVSSSWAFDRPSSLRRR